jgi:hypothetical protein
MAEITGQTEDFDKPADKSTELLQELITIARKG